MKPSFFQKHPILKDILSLCLFIVAIVIGTILLTKYVYRSYNVIGKSMEPTFYDAERVIVNRLAVSWAHFTGNEYIPERGQVIVFANEDKTLANRLREEKAHELNIDVSEVGSVVTCNVPNDVVDQYIIKRVIAFPGERVVVKDGEMLIYNEEHPEGYDYNIEWRDLDAGTGPKEYTSGEVDTIVPEGELFVSGDNREGSNSWDSRNGLGTIPFCRIIGPVAIRIYPFDRITLF